MPADALTQATEQLAPARASTNFFDPTQGQDVLSRYASARMAAEGAAVANEAATRLAASRIDRAAERRRAMLFDRDEKDYQEKTDFKAQRGEFLSQLSQIDPNAEDYDKTVTEFVSKLPPAALQDDAVQAILTHKNKVADSIRQEKEMRARTDYSFDQRRKLQEEKAVARFTEMGLPPEKIVRDAEGNIDVAETSYLAGRAASEAKKGDTLEIATEKAKMAAEGKAAKDTEINRRKSVMEVGVADQGAFPSQVVAFEKSNPQYDPDTATPEQKAAYLEAKNYEKQKLNSEMASALNYDTADAYANLVPNATAKQKAKRRDLWNLAREMSGNAEPAKAEPEPAKAAAPKIRKFNLATGKFE